MIYTFVDLERLKHVVEQQIGKPYEFGHEVDLHDSDPEKFDCSEFVQWSWAQIGFKVPDGSWNQYHDSVAVSHIQFGDLGFLMNKEGDRKTRHVGMIYNEDQTIEARGEPYNCVTLFPRSEWEKHPDFSGWRRFMLFTYTDPNFTAGI